MNMTDTIYDEETANNIDSSNNTLLIAENRLAAEYIDDIDENFEETPGIDRTRNAGNNALPNRDINGNNQISNTDINNSTNNDEENEESILDELLDEAISSSSKTIVYNKFESAGIVGDVHNDKAWCEIELRGSDFVRGNVDDVGEYNCLSIKQFEGNKRKAIDGGQIYCPRNINSDFSKLEQKAINIINMLPVHITNMLSPNVTKIMNNDISIENVRSVMSELETIFGKIIEFEKSHDQDRGRIELTFSHTINDCDDPDYEAFWPSCRTQSGTKSLLQPNKCFLFVKQSERYKFFKNFYTENFVPLMRVVNETSDNISLLSPQCKTKLVWCAENIVANTMNGFFKGKIHQKVSGLCDPRGKITIPTAFRSVMSERDKSISKTNWGIDPLLYCSPNNNQKLSDNPLDFDFALKRSITDLRNKIDFPYIYVEYSRRMWTVIQRYSHGLFDEDESEIGFFEEPNWDSMIGLSDMQFAIFLQKMFLILIDGYRLNRTKILLQTARKKKWSFSRDDEQLNEAPLCQGTVKLFPNKLFMTNSLFFLRPTEVEREIRVIDRSPITDASKYISIFF